MTLAPPKPDLAPAPVAGAGRPRRGLVLTIGAAVLLACVLLSLAFGAREVGLDDILAGLSGADPQTVGNPRLIDARGYAAIYGRLLEAS